MKFEAVIFDLDGVITDTDSVHFLAWQQLFKSLNYNFTYSDYLLYVDGKLREDGLKDFLAIRGAQLPPLGTSQDSPDACSIHGLAKRKNQLFLNLIQTQGVKVFPAVVNLLDGLTKQGIKLAVVSSSKNCAHILDAAKLTKKFSTLVDGDFLEKKNLPGKPAPHLFRLAAEKLSVLPANCLVIEDAIVGVQAARAGGFGLVVGIDHTGKRKKTFLKEGADFVFLSLAELNIEDIKKWLSYSLPSALSEFHEIKNKYPVNTLAIFIDYDGTLTPIVSHPKLAILSLAMRKCLRNLSALFPVSIVSGRELSNLREKVRIENIYYVGNHGFEMANFSGKVIAVPVSKKILLNIDKFYHAILKQCKHISGIIIEHKIYSLSIHYRLVKNKKSITEIEHILDKALIDYPVLTKRTGKKIFEIRPNLNWHKGKAVDFILKKLQIRKSKQCPIYIGDNSTDEDAFLYVKTNGIGILVSSKPKQTAASYSLRNCEEVQQFLGKLIEYANERQYQ